MQSWKECGFQSFSFSRVQNPGFSVLCGMCHLVGPTISRVSYFPQVRLERSDVKFLFLLPLRQGGTGPVSLRGCTQRILKSLLQKREQYETKVLFLLRPLPLLPILDEQIEKTVCCHLLTRNWRWDDGVILDPVSQPCWITDLLMGLQKSG